MSRLVLRTTHIALLITTLAAAEEAQAPPGADDAKRAIEKSLKKIWKDLGTAGERTVLFQSVVAGNASPGSYPFRVSLLIHDHETGYPPNHYYGKTCVGRIEEEPYTLMRDNFGTWLAQGRMTPNLSDTTCKNNTAAGVASIPLAGLPGTQAVVAGNPSPSSAAAKAPPAAAGGQAGVAVGSYQCWANGQARLLLNFSILNDNQYRDSNGVTGAFRIDPSNARITFRGGTLDGFMPPGFYSVYYAPQGLPTVSFRNSGGSEVTFCQKAN